MPQELFHQGGKSDECLVLVIRKAKKLIIILDVIYIRFRD